MPRQGFTVVEVIVAMLILCTGIAALVGSSALVTRQLGRSRSIDRATQMAVRRLEALRAAASHRMAPGRGRCQHPSFAGGTDAVPGMREEWSVAPGGALRTASVVVTYTRTGGTSEVALHTRIACY
ncbi:MAG TPA: type II secretion system protein [Gemmatimonadales bacterium]|nr:type II secretion system protein [Gemmatimonadales bacterium]